MTLRRSRDPGTFTRAALRSRTVPEHPAAGPRQRSLSATRRRRSALALVPTSVTFGRSPSGAGPGSGPGTTAAAAVVNCLDVLAPVPPGVVTTSVYAYPLAGASPESGALIAWPSDTAWSAVENVVPPASVSSKCAVPASPSVATVPRAVALVAVTSLAASDVAVGGKAVVCSVAMSDALEPPSLEATIL